jgi:hypothetical protein
MKEIGKTIRNMELVSKNILELEIIMGTGKTDRDTGKEL